MSERDSTSQITLWPLEATTLDALRIDFAPAEPLAPDVQSRIDRAWIELTQSNPRLYDGPVLLADMHALRNRASLSSTIIAHHHTYRTLVCAAAAGLTGPLAPRALGVQGLITARDRAGAPHLLLARRSSHTRIYQGLWENAPSGTLSCDPSTTSLTGTFIAHSLAQEALEELGMAFDPLTAKPIALLEDAQANSLDIVLSITLPERIDPRQTPCSHTLDDRWEYVDVAWIALDDLPSWIAKHAESISPPTRELLRELPPN